MSDNRERACHAVRTWMRLVLDEKGWTANEWALAAHTTPTNITRLIGGDNKVPSVETVMKLASVARSQPDLIGVGEELPGAVERPKFCPECGVSLERFSHPRMRVRRRPIPAGPG